MMIFPSYASLPEGKPNIFRHLGAFQGHLQPPVIPVAGHGGIAAQRRQGGGALGAEGRYVRAAQGGRPGDRIRPEDRDRNPGGLTWFLVGGFHV